MAPGERPHFRRRQGVRAGGPRAHPADFFSGTLRLCARMGPFFVLSFVAFANFVVSSQALGVRLEAVGKWCAEHTLPAVAAFVRLAFTEGPGNPNLEIRSKPQ
jgi:hypothetical protein